MPKIPIFLDSPLAIKITEVYKKYPDYFDKETMSVHLKENSYAYAKKGFPGEWNLVKIDNKKLSNENIAQALS